MKAPLATPTIGRESRPARVLIVDDDSGMRMLCAVNLQLAGLDVLQAEDGRSGLAQARSARPDLILTDVRMPILDGFQLAEALQADAATHGIPVIFVSGESTIVNRDRALGLGALAYVTKPFDPLELASLVAEAITQRGSSTPPRRLRAVEPIDEPPRAA